jgi:hypothetical protein
MPKESFEVFTKKVKKANKILDMILSELASQQDTFVELYGHPNQLRVTTTVDVDGKEDVEYPEQLDNSKKVVNKIQHIPNQDTGVLIGDIRKQLSEDIFIEGVRKWIARKIFSDKRMKHAAIGAGIGTAAGLAVGFTGAYKSCKEKAEGDKEKLKNCIQRILRIGKKK